jgi:hypothetical protein
MREREREGLTEALDWLVLLHVTVFVLGSHVRFRSGRAVSERERRGKRRLRWGERELALVNARVADPEERVESGLRRRSFVLGKQRTRSHQTRDEEQERRFPRCSFGRRDEQSRTIPLSLAIVLSAVIEPERESKR